MILTGDEILKEVERENIVIQPFDKSNIEPNTYGFHLGDEVIIYDSNEYLNSKEKLNYQKFPIPKEGMVLEPGKFYLISTMEKMGSNKYAKTLHARFGVSSMGMWIQFSAPLGHVGAIINWTLEITVAHKIRIYPNMKVGKIAFWKMMGDINLYNGKYFNSTNVVASRIVKDFK